jgi:hypothetical protein
MRVIAGMRGNDNADETTILLYDPWPPLPSAGKIESTIYGKLITQYPTTTYQLFYR